MKCPACDFPNIKVTPTKREGYSVSCPECGFQGFAKTPKAAGAIKAKSAGSSAKAPDAPKKKDILDEL